MKWLRWKKDTELIKLEQQTIIVKVGSVDSFTCYPTAAPRSHPSLLYMLGLFSHHGPGLSFSNCINLTMIFCVPFLLTKYPNMRFNVCYPMFKTTHLKQHLLPDVNQCQFIHGEQAMTIIDLLGIHGKQVRAILIR